MGLARCSPALPSLCSLPSCSTAVGLDPIPAHLGGGGSRVLVTQRTMREAPEAPRVAGLLQRKREESVTHGMALRACSRTHTAGVARTHPIMAHAAPLTPTMAHTRTLARHTWCRSHPPAGRAHPAPLTRTLTHTTSPGCTPTGYPQAHTPAHADRDGCRWTRVAHAQPCTRTLTHTCARTHNPPMVMVLCTPALCRYPCQGG